MRFARWSMAGERLERFPFGTIDSTEMWKIGEKVRAERGRIPLNPHYGGSVYRSYDVPRSMYYVKRAIAILKLSMSQS